MFLLRIIVRLFKVITVLPAIATLWVSAFIFIVIILAFKPIIYIVFGAYFNEESVFDWLFKYPIMNRIYSFYDIY